MRRIFVPPFKYLVVVPFEAMVYSATFAITMLFTLSYEDAHKQWRDIHDVYRLDIDKENKVTQLTFREYIKMPTVL